MRDLMPGSSPSITHRFITSQWGVQKDEFQEKQESGSGWNMLEQHLFEIMVFFGFQEMVKMFRLWNDPGVPSTGPGFHRFSCTIFFHDRLAGGSQGFQPNSSCTAEQNDICVDQDMTHLYWPVATGTWLDYFSILCWECHHPYWRTRSVNHP